MKTYIVTLRVDVSKDVPDLTDKIAGRAYTIDGVEDVQVIDPPLQTLTDIHQEIERGSS